MTFHLTTSATASENQLAMSEPVPTAAGSTSKNDHTSSETPNTQEASSTTAKTTAATATDLPARPRKRQPCRFFATKKGCRAGGQCPFLHDASRLEAATASPNASSTQVQQPKEGPAQTTSTEPQGAGGAESSASGAARRLPPLGRPAVDQNRVVQRPVPKAASQDPRGFQIGQVKRRYNAKEDSKPEGVTELSFDMVPSDPDFPFEIDSLKCLIKLYPAFPMRPPSLRVSNKEMERGYQVNVERGFDLIWRQAANPTLLGAIKELDKKLEQLLTAQKADIIKIVAPMRALVPKEERDLPREPEFTKTVPIETPQPEKKPVERRPEPSKERKQQAQEKRADEVRILEHRLSRDPLFARLADGTIYTVPIQPRKRDSLPVSLQPVKAIQLYVPTSYDIEPCSIELLGVSGEGVKNVEAAFMKRAQESPDSTLLAHVNYLASNIHIMATQPAEPPAPPKPEVLPEIVPEVVQQPEEQSSQNKDIIDTEKSHVKIIARPVEWNVAPRGEDDETESDDEDDSSFSDTDSGTDGGKEEALDENKTSSTLRERGIMLSFPSLDLHNVELLELQSVSLTVKCERCKDLTTVSNISNNVLADPPQLRSERCKKCATQFSLGFRRDIMHANSIRAGYLDLEGCTPFDLLLSPFAPTCSLCSTVHAPVSAVRGDAAMAICRECHAHLSFTIKETKFLRISAAAPLSAGTLPRKKPKDSLGIVAGTELPRTGRCRHYGKSHRWFRFSCCDKVYPCDRCHDAVEKDHVQEFANRMICGFCSREQNYRPEECGICRRVLTGKKGRGFWEGGKGTRDPNKMSRKDPRKYKRRGGGAVKKNLKDKYET